MIGVSSVRRQGQVMRKYLRFIFGTERRQRHIRLHNAQLDPRYQSWRGLRQTPGAKAGNSTKGQECSDDWRREAAPRPSHRGFFAEHRGSGKNEDGDDGETVKANDRSQLRGQKIAAERHAESVPGKSG